MKKVLWNEYSEVRVSILSFVFGNFDFEFRFRFILDIYTQNLREIPLESKHPNFYGWNGNNFSWNISIFRTDLQCPTTTNIVSSLELTTKIIRIQTIKLGYFASCRIDGRMAVNYSLNFFLKKYFQSGRIGGRILTVTLTYIILYHNEGATQNDCLFFVAL